MAVSPTGIIPESMMNHQSFTAVMELLKAIPIPGDEKVSILMGWAHAVGATVNGSQRAAVRDSGVDRQ